MCRVVYEIAGLAPAMRLLGASVSFRWGSVSEPASGMQPPDEGVAA